MVPDLERRGLLAKVLKTEQVNLTGDSVLVVARAVSGNATCPQCGRPRDRFTAGAR